MATETELKLSIDPEAISTLLKHPLLQNTPTHQHLANTYFDTDDLALTRQKVAVRERKMLNQTLLTVKTAGQTQGGLSQRQEWEGPTQPGAFDFRQLVSDAAVAGTLTTVANQLVPVFTTDFERRTWLVTVANSTVEVALDRGTIQANRHGRQGQLPLCELELELKAGDIDALLMLAAQLQAHVALKPTDESKAARGYALFHSLAA
ncbi:MAG: CYTH domain-containing protein [Rhodocyclaceae bacterium]|nr:CYTH domain-containing protein [Rhodocyclaceae bacterium]